MISSLSVSLICEKLSREIITAELQIDEMQIERRRQLNIVVGLGAYFIDLFAMIGTFSKKGKALYFITNSLFLLGFILFLMQMFFLSNIMLVVSTTLLFTIACLFWKLQTINFQRLIIHSHR